MPDASPRTLVLWDIDHTLVDDGGTAADVFRLAFDLLTGEQVDVDLDIAGRTERDVMALLFERHEIEAPDPSAVKQALCVALRRQAPALRARGRVLPGAREALAAVAARPRTLPSVLTGDVKDNAKIKLDAFGLREHLKLSLGGFGFASRARADLVPVAWAKAGERAGFDAEREATVLVGDTERDVEAGLSAGVAVLAVATGPHSVARLTAAGATVVLPDLRDTAAVLAALQRCAVRA